MSVQALPWNKPLTSFRGYMQIMHATQIILDRCIPLAQLDLTFKLRFAHLPSSPRHGFSPTLGALKLQCSSVSHDTS